MKSKLTGEKGFWAYQLFQQQQHQPVALKFLKKKIKSNIYFINNNYKAPQLVSL